MEILFPPPRSILVTDLVLITKVHCERSLHSRTCFPTIIAQVQLLVGPGH
jgi:hypothetical protein